MEDSGDGGGRGPKKPWTLSDSMFGARKKTEHARAFFNTHKLYKAHTFATRHTPSYSITLRHKLYKAHT